MCLSGGARPSTGATAEDLPVPSHCSREPPSLLLLEAPLRTPRVGAGQCGNTDTAVVGRPWACPAGAQAGSEPLSPRPWLLQGHDLVTQDGAFLSPSSPPGLLPGSPGGRPWP